MTDREREAARRRRFKERTNGANLSLRLFVSTPLLKATRLFLGGDGAIIASSKMSLQGLAFPFRALYKSFTGACVRGSLKI